MTLIILSFIALALHEAGHLALSRLIGVPLISFSAKPVGFSMKFDFSRVSYLGEAAVHLAGPVAGVIGAVVALMIFRERGYTFFGISAVLSAVNLLPIAGFDGGGILFCILSSLFSPYTACRIFCILSGVSLLLLWAAVLWIELRVGANLSLLVFVLFFIVKAA